jgi:5-methylcytosine-specific restriction endonuclease McrA
MSPSLRSLSDHVLLSSIRTLTRRERSLTLNVLLHLIEIERRGLHLELAYKSMFDYCTRELGYSASAASRRIRSARCVARFPDVYELLESNEVNISTIAQVSRILNPANKDDILARIRGKSQNEVEAIVAEYEPSAAIPRDRVRTIVVRQPLVPLEARAGRSPSAPITDQSKASAEPHREGPHDRYGRECKDVADSPGGHGGGANGPTLALERRREIRFCAGEAFMEKLEQAKALVWHRLPLNASFEQLFELALDFLIERQSPAARRERRDRREQHRDRGRPETGGMPGLSSESRHISAAVRDEVHVRDQGRCTFVGSTGRRCGSKTALQIDHVQPFALGGRGTAGNLRLLCAYHNRLEARRLLGPCGLAPPSP